MNIFFRAITALLFILLGFTLGLIVNDFPLLTLDTKVGIGDVANIILAVVVAFLVPISLTTWLDNKRHVKDFIIEEIQECLGTIRCIKEYVDSCCITKKTLRKDIIKIMFKLKDNERQISSLRNQLKESFSFKSKKMVNELITQQSEYWKRLTDGDLLSKGYKINSDFCKDHDAAFYKFQDYLKKCIHSVNNF